MSEALSKMLADMLLKQLPQEVREQLTLENFNKVVGACTQTIKELRIGIAELKSDSVIQIELLKEISEKVSANGGSDSKRKPARRTPGGSLNVGASGGSD